MVTKKQKPETDIAPIPFNDALKRVWSAPHKPKTKKKVTKNKK